MDQTAKAEADRRFEEAVEAPGARDPRDFYRQALRDWKEPNPAGDARAVAHVRNVLGPGIASGDLEPNGAWRETGRLIAEETAAGTTTEPTTMVSSSGAA